MRMTTLRLMSTSLNKQVYLACLNQKVFLLRMFHLTALDMVIHYRNYSALTDELCCNDILDYITLGFGFGSLFC